MILVFRNNKLLFKKKVYRCSLGINGLTSNKKEGDGCTPIGNFSLGKIYFRDDRVNLKNTKKEKVPIKKNMYWSDNPRSIFYNQLILRNKYHSEKLYRSDNIYDILIVVNFNTTPIKKNLGSAIFLHIAKKNYQPTKGCIGLSQSDLLEIIGYITLKERIKIFPNSYISA